MEIITQELSTVDVQDVKVVVLLPHLNGAINKAIRLLPAIMTSGTRITPPEGLTIAETFIPGDVKIAAPRYSIGRSELDQPLHTNDSSSYGDCRPLADYTFHSS